jgi:ADP-ribosyl-[dinitrogen reductase] hydrolase
LEFAARDSRPPLVDMVGGGPFGLKAGQWTDDTAMALALADSLASCGVLDEQDLLGRFTDWWKTGSYSCTGQCFDIGATTQQALSRWQRTKADHCGDTDPFSAGNGSLMRLSPVAIRYYNNRPALRDAAARQSKTTHAAPEAVDACVVYSEVIADAIEGQTRSQVLRARVGGWAGVIDAIAGGSWRGKARTAIRASGYVAHTLEAALWSVGRSPDVRGSILLAANLGEDADTTAAIAGQVAGALGGASAIPAPWLAMLAWQDRLKAAAVALCRDKS